MAWSYDIPDDIPVDDDGVPRHPERGYPVCGHMKTDATANNGMKREDIDGCLMAAGWGTDRDTGACRKHKGATPGGPEGWRNGNARHLLYSEAMNDEDQERFEALVAHPNEDGELMRLEDAVDMLKNMLAWEQTRVLRAIEVLPDVERVDVFKCPECGERHHNEPAGECDGEKRIGPNNIDACRYSGEFDRVKSYVKTNDKPVERKEQHIANLAQTLNRLAPGADVSVEGTHKHKHEGGDEPVEVNVSHVGVDLPDDAKADKDTDDEGEAEE